MKNNNLLFLVLCCTFLFGACEKEIEFNGEVKQPVLVMNGFLTPDSMVAVHLSKSRFVMDSGTRFTVVENANVEVYVNGNLKETLKYASDGFYRGTYYPKINDKIEIRAVAQGFASIQAETTIPVAPAFTLSDSTITYTYKDATQYFPPENGVTYKMLSQDNQIRLSLKDNPKEENFYFMKAGDKSYSGNQLMQANIHRVDLRKIVKSDTGGSGSIFDLLFDEEDGNNSNMRNVFADALVNGKELFFDFQFVDNIKIMKYVNGKETNEPADEIEKEYVITLSNMSKEYYQFIVSSSKAYDTSENPFVEPIQVKTNVENGLGILASYTTSVFSYRFKMHSLGWYY